MKRHTPLKRTGPILRRTRLRTVSKKRSRELAKYRVKREWFLAERHNCEIGPLLWNADILESNCDYSATEIHHKRRRLGGNLNDETTWLPTRANCHRWIETHANVARRLGIIET
jgi:hypothetical protein